MDLESCRNAIEEPVIEEAEAQLKRLDSTLQKQVDTCAVIAYALNRLPPMYATTQKGWAQQRKRAREELNLQITGAVRQGMLGTRRDMLRQSTPLPEVELESQARSLFKLQKLLDSPNLKWRDVPMALQEAVMNVRSKGSVSSVHLSMSKRNAIAIQGYLKRSKPIETNHLQSMITPTEKALQASLEAKEFSTYMLGVSWEYRNILENLVASVCELQLKRLEPEARVKVTLNEVVAYTLNRLPPMYATSSNGFQQLRQKAKTEMSHEIVAAVRQAVLKVGQRPNRLLPPLTIEKFSKEQDVALRKLSQLLDISDLTWRNVAEVIEQILAQTKNGETLWLRRLQENSNL